jgi:H+/Cl- antiporter ClcA
LHGLLLGPMIMAEKSNMTVSPVDRPWHVARDLGFGSAGLGGITFYIASRVVEHYALRVWAGYCPSPHPGGEPSFTWLSAVEHPFHPWLLLLIPTLGGIVSGPLVFTLAPEAEGHGTDAVIAAYHHHQGHHPFR